MAGPAALRDQEFPPRLTAQSHTDRALVEISPRVATYDRGKTNTISEEDEVLSEKGKEVSIHIDASPRDSPTAEEVEPELSVPV